MDDLQHIRELWNDVGPATSEERNMARVQLMEHIASSAKRESAPRRLAVRLKSRMVVSLAAAAGACVAAVALLVVGSTSEVTPSAAAALSRAARVASAQVPLAVHGAGKFLFTRSREGVVVISMRVGPGVEHSGESEAGAPPSSGVQPHPWSFFEQRERESWVAANGAGRMLESRGAGRLLSAQERRAWIAAGRPPLPKPGPMPERKYGPGGLFTVANLNLPTEPVALRKVLESGNIKGLHAQPGTHGILGTIGILLHETYASPALRAALYEVAASLPGLRLLGPTTDSMGRKGLGVAEEIHGYRHVLVFDPQTAVLLGQRDVVINPRISGIAAPTGTVFGYATYSRPRIVNGDQNSPDA